MSARSLLIAALLAIPVGAGATTITSFNFTGETQSFTAAVTGIYSISTRGGSGGSGLTSGGVATTGGLGAFVNISTQLTAGMTYSIVVGGAGASAEDPELGGTGGGGTFIFDSNNFLLAAAGGGGGGGSSAAANGSGLNASILSAGVVGQSSGSAFGGGGGANGMGGIRGQTAIVVNQPFVQGGSGGGGFFTYGTSGFLGLGGASGIAGATAGGGGFSGGGGGGGYNGGGGGGGNAGGGGGSSFYAAATKLIGRGTNSSTGDGFAEIDFISFVDPLPDPASWMTMIAGFTVIGTAMRRKRQTAALVAA